MSLSSLPTELLREIVQHFRPFNKDEPITGLNATWRPLGMFRSSLTARSRPTIGGEAPKSDQANQEQTDLTYSSLIALRSTCSLMRELCAPFIFENLNLIDTISNFEDYYSSMLEPNAAHVRNIRIDLDKMTVSEYTRCLGVCKNATSLAFYSDDFDSSFTSCREINSTYTAVVEMLEEGSLDTIGLYSPELLNSAWSFFAEPIYEFPLLNLILDSVKSKKALKRLDLGIYGKFEDGVYDRIRTELPSLEALTITHLLDSLSEDLWPLDGRIRWGQYDNLQRLEFRDCGAVYANRIPYLVRHFPSLIHILLSTCDSGAGGYNIKPSDWHERKDALWKVRKPLETLHLEHMLGIEILAMGEVPVKTLIVANLRGDFLTDTMMEDTKIFPGLQVIHIQPEIIPEYEDGGHPFDTKSLAALNVICKARELTLLRDAEATRLSPRHHY